MAFDGAAAPVQGEIGGDGILVATQAADLITDLYAPHSGQSLFDSFSVGT
ncbi:hypothetical protein J2W56_006460 [Nocardia kruczakiae]|uniref:Uncharacterized protein n=1 Tax=Nocardia kruczakiae TaxID=261477 RepID=A0ABU1XQ49_9NOCA|nr:hypothetical protein [Nocardia kruczakiae]MDR7172694.1 hypothetical protein [Nocardia kruczakiae]